MNKIIIFLALLALTAPVRAAVYDIDAVHSSVSFKIRHMVVGKTTGKFNKFSGVIHYDGENAKTWKAEATIETASIDTDNEKRDGHLRGSDFLDVKKYPTMTFKSMRIKKRKGGRPEIHGKLTLHGVTRDVVLDLEEHDAVPGRAGFSATTTIDRMDFGITWNKVLDSGGIAVGKIITITLEIEAIERKSNKEKAKK